MKGNAIEKKRMNKAEMDVNRDHLDCEIPAILKVLREIERYA